LDSTAAISVSSQLVRTAQEWPMLVAVTESADALDCEKLLELGCEVIVLPGARRVGVVPLLEEFARRDMTNVLVEGGGRVLGSFLDAHQLDEIDAYIAPLIEGGAHNSTAIRGDGYLAMCDAMRLAGTEVTQVDGDLRVRGWLRQPWRTLAGFGSDLVTLTTGTAAR